MELTIGIQNKETTEAGTLIITMNPVNTARWISTPELITAEIAVQPYGVISVPDYEDLAETELMCYVTLNYVTYGAGLANLIAGSIGDEITFTATGTGGGGSQNDAEITKMIEKELYSLYDSSATFVGSSAMTFARLTDVEFIAVVSIYNGAFSRAGLVTASFPEATWIYGSAFQSCASLTSIYIPKVSRIDGSAFYNCTSLKNITLSKVETMGAAFTGCTALESIDAPICTTAGQDVFKNCTALKTVALGNVSSLGISAFYGCTSLTDVSLPGTKSLAENGFYNCTALSYIELPGVGPIGSNAFNGCTSLKTVILGASTAGVIYSSAFKNCAALESLYIYASGTYTLRTGAFDGTPMSDSSYLGAFGSIYVPASKVDTYKAANNWSAFADRITAIPEVTTE